MAEGIVIEPSASKVVYDGRTWHKSPTANYFYAHFYTEGVRRHVALHRYIFEKYSASKIAPAADIHHKDHDYRHNLFRNLVQVDSALHNSYHFKKVWRENRQKMIKATETGRLQAKKWHSTQAGRRWHSEHGRAVWKTRAKFARVKECKGCGGPFKAYRPDATYCSRTCWARENYHSQKFFVVCEWCGQHCYKRERRTRFCSRRCAALSRESRKA